MTDAELLAERLVAAAVDTGVLEFMTAARMLLENWSIDNVARKYADTDVETLIRRWQKNRRGKRRVARQRKNLQRGVGELTGERDRARRDRAELKRFIQSTTGMAVTGKSGSWRVEPPTQETDR